MTTKARKIPSYRLHKPTGQSVVRLDGRDFYLGKYGTEESREAYHRKVAEWLALGRVAIPRQHDHRDAGPRRTVNDLVLEYWRHAEGRYRRPDGAASSELEKIRLAIRPLRKLYGSTPAPDFGPRALKAVRQVLIDQGLCRRTINQRVARIVRLFRYGVENEIIPPGVYQALKAVEGLRAGVSRARESRSVRPVPDKRVDVVLPFLSRQLRAVVQLQRLTGMRSGEALTMRTRDLDMSGETWEYTPERHKTEHHGKRRRIFLGPRAREILRRWLRPDPAEYLFQPAEAEAERQTRRRSARRTPMTPSQRARSRKAKPSKAPGDRYDARSCAHAVARACDQAFPHPTLSRVRAKDLSLDQREELERWRRANRWHPHQLRHSAATEIRRGFGLEVARVVLGHSSPAVTELYAEVDKERAASAMERIG